jgi:AraC-like DNA-binding protein
MRSTRPERAQVGDPGRGPGRPAESSPLATVLTEEFLRREYVQLAKSATAVAAEVGCSPKTVLRHLGSHGIPVRRGSAAAGLAGPDQLRRWYVQERLAIPEIAARAGGSPRAVRSLLARWAIHRPRAVAAPSLSAGELWRAYVVEGGSTTQIAAAAGCGASTVARRLRAAGIALRPRGGARPA